MYLHFTTRSLSMTCKCLLQLQSFFILNTTLVNLLAFVAPQDNFINITSLGTMLALREWFSDSNILNWSKTNAHIKLKAVAVLLLKNGNVSLEFPSSKHTIQTSYSELPHHHFFRAVVRFDPLPSPADGTGKIPEKNNRRHSSL